MRASETPDLVSEAFKCSRPGAGATILLLHVRHDLEHSTSVSNLSRVQWRETRREGHASAQQTWRTQTPATLARHDDVRLRTESTCLPHPWKEELGQHNRRTAGTESMIHR